MSLWESLNKQYYSLNYQQLLFVTIISQPRCISEHNEQLKYVWLNYNREQLEL
jgi:hypothetical protein